MEDFSREIVHPETRPEDLDFCATVTYRGMMFTGVPRRGERRECRHAQDYWVEKIEISEVDLEDASFDYE